MSDVDRAIRARTAKSPHFQAMVEKELAELRVGFVIKELRQKNGMTQEELSRVIIARLTPQPNHRNKTRYRGELPTGLPLRGF
jgi:hypothetical protein